MKISLFRIFLIGALTLGVIGVVYIYKSRKNAAAAVSPMITPDQLQYLFNNPYQGWYHPPPGYPGSDISYLYGTNSYGYTNQGYSPYNVYKIPTGLVQSNPPGSPLYSGTGQNVYEYAGNRVPDFLLSPSAVANLNQTRYLQSLWQVPNPLLATSESNPQLFM